MISSSRVSALVSLLLPLFLLTEETTGANINIFSGSMNLRDDTTTSTSNNVNNGILTGSCGDDSNALFVHEDIRTELMTLRVQYMEHGSVSQACVQGGSTNSGDDHMDCRVDFRLFPSRLQQRCQANGGRYDESEHSIQCHSPTARQSLYFQYDHYPSCYALSCEEQQVRDQVAQQIDAMKVALEADTGLQCYTDNDILAHAVAASQQEDNDSSGGGRSLSSLATLGSLIMRGALVLVGLPIATAVIL